MRRSNKIPIKIAFFGGDLVEECVHSQNDFRSDFVRTLVDLRVHDGQTVKA